MLVQQVNSRDKFVCAVAFALLLPACNSDHQPHGQSSETPTRSQSIDVSETSFVAAPIDGHVKHTFMLRNCGQETLEISDVDSSCGCTVATLEQTTLAPGETAALDVDLHVTPERTSSTVYIHSTDPVAAILAVQIAADRVPEGTGRLELIPGIVRIDSVPGTLVHGECVLKFVAWDWSGGQEVFETATLESSSPDFAAELADISQAGAGTVVEWETAPTSSVSGGTLVAEHASRREFLTLVRYRFRVPDEIGKHRFYIAAKLSEPEVVSPPLTFVVSARKIAVASHEAQSPARNEANPTLKTENK
jgi:hypothetical protein